jgi:metal-responsive CopG/Arc/MetJ family transcriptional regulator
MHRLGISISEEDLRHVRSLQKRFGIKSRSEFFRELVKRYERLEQERSALDQCVEAYRRHPETPEEIQEMEAILKASASTWPAEDWTS